MKKSQKQLECFTQIRNSDTSAATAAKIKAVDDYALELADVISKYRERGIKTLGQISNQLVKDGIEKRKGGCKWTRTDVLRLLERMDKLSVGKPFTLESFFD